MVVVLSCALISILGFVLEGSLFVGQLLLELGNHELVLTSPLLGLLLLLGLYPGFILFERGFEVFLGQLEVLRELFLDLGIGFVGLVLD